MADLQESQAAQTVTPSEPAVQDKVQTAQDGSKGKSKKKVWIIIAIVIVLLLAVGGWFIFSSPSDETESETTEEVTPTKTPTNTPTPSKEIDKADISIQVLNGTGIAGEATFVAEELEELGYTDVEAENADTKDVVVTTITFVSGVSKAVQDEIIELLEEYYEDVETDTASSLGGFDVKILLGYRIGHTPTPIESESTPTPTETESETTPTTSPTPTETE